MCEQHVVYFSLTLIFPTVVSHLVCPMCVSLTPVTVPIGMHTFDWLSSITYDDLNKC